MPLPYPGDDWIRQHPARSPGEAIQYRARYNERDWAHRHRLEDEQPKDVQVITYRRRKPAKPERREATV